MYVWVGGCGYVVCVYNTSLSISNSISKRLTCISIFIHISMHTSMCTLAHALHTERENIYTYILYIYIYVCVCVCVL